MEDYPLSLTVLPRTVLGMKTFDIIFCIFLLIINMSSTSKRDPRPPCIFGLFAKGFHWVPMVSDGSQKKWGPPVSRTSCLRCPVTRPRSTKVESLFFPCSPMKPGTDTTKVLLCC